MNQEYTDRFGEMEQAFDVTMRKIEDKFTELNRHSSDMTGNKLTELEKSTSNRFKHTEIEIAKIMNSMKLSENETREIFKKEIGETSEKVIKMMHELQEVDNIMQMSANGTDEENEKSMIVTEEKKSDLLENPVRSIKASEETKNYENLRIETQKPARKNLSTTVRDEILNDPNTAIYDMSPDIKINDSRVDTNLSDISPFRLRDHLDSETTKQSESNRRLKSFIKNLNIRLSTLENKVKDTSIKSLLTEELLQIDPKSNYAKSRDEQELELNLKYVAILSQLNEYKKQVRSFSTSISDYNLETNTSDNMVKYIPYISRITRLEENMENVVVKEEMDGLYKELDDLRRILKGKIEKEEVGEMLFKIGTIDEEIAKVKSSNLTLTNSHSRSPKFVEIVTDVKETVPTVDLDKLLELEASVKAINENISSIQQTLPLKAFRSEFEEIFNLKGNTISKNSAQVNSLDVEERLKQIEDRLNVYHYDIQRFKKDVRSKSPDEVNEFHKIIENSVENQVANMRLELNNRYEELYDIISRPSNEGEISNIHILRGVLVKVQKDTKELAEKLTKIEDTIDKHQSPAADEIKEDEVEEIDSTNSKKMLTSIKRHEGLFKIMKDQITKIYSELEIHQQNSKKQSDANINTSLKMFEELRSNVGDVMSKISEGTRLNQRDMQKINDVFVVLEAKGNKEDIMQKVDKNELKKTYRYLSKKIDDLQRKLKVAEENKEISKPRDDPTMFKQKLGMECLACGQELSIVQHNHKGD